MAASSLFSMAVRSLRHSRNNEQQQQQQREAPARGRLVFACVRLAFVETCGDDGQLQEIAPPGAFIAISIPVTSIT